MLLHDILMEFERGNLELDCPEMRVEQDAVEQPMVYSGPGLIRLTSDRQLEFRLFCTHRTGEPPFYDPFSPEGDVAAGEIVPGHHYYTLRAWDQFGVEWVGRRIEIGRDSGKGLVLSGRPLEIRRKGKTAQTESVVVLRVRSDYDIPVNTVSRETHLTGGEQWARTFRRDASMFDACGCAFIVKREDGWMTVRASTNSGDLPEQVETRVTEALQFVLGRSVWWSVMSKVAAGEEVTCLRAERGRAGTHLMPPFNFGANPDAAPAWQMFEKYLRHVWDCRGHRFHATSAWLNMVRNASAGSVFSSGLALGVAIEGVLKTEFGDVGSVPADLPEQVRAAKEHVERWPGDARLKRRIIGSINGMLEVRAKDRLHTLKDRGVVDSQQIAAWGKLRNSAAHARPPEDDELQEWVDLGNVGLVMLYHLIFAAIGYTGVYTNYAVRNWPTASYSTTTEKAFGPRADLE